MLAGLGTRFPALLDYDDAQRDHTAQDVAHFVGFLNPHDRFATHPHSTGY
ncbi:hypothetical protein [Streptomyces lunalinharesii]